MGAEGRGRSARALSIGLPSAAIVLASWLVYAPALHGGWLWDDDTEILLNRVLRDPAAPWKIWVHPMGADYFPLKTLVQWVQWHLWGDRIAPYHATSLALHVIGALLFWRVLSRLGVRRGWIGGLLEERAVVAADAAVLFGLFEI